MQRGTPSWAQVSRGRRKAGKDLKPPGCSQHLYRTGWLCILLEDISELKSNTFCQHLLQSAFDSCCACLEQKSQVCYLPGLIENEVIERCKIQNSCVHGVNAVRAGAATWQWPAGKGIPQQTLPGCSPVLVVTGFTFVRSSKRCSFSSSPRKALTSSSNDSLRSFWMRESSLWPFS